MPRFFNVTKETVAFGVGNSISFEFPVVSPNGNSQLLDVVNDFQWKNNITKQGIPEVPSIVLTEFTMPYGRWLQNLINLFVNVAALQSGNNDPYGILYKGVPTGFNYNLPYLIKPGNSIRGDVKNTWTEVDFKSIPVIGTFLQQVNDFAELIVPGYGFERTSAYSSTAKKTIEISFPLYNTVDLQKTIDNFWFITLFALQNLKVRTTYLTYIPPKIYSVESIGFGGVFMPAAYVKSYRVDSIGATRTIDIGESAPVLIPEAYKVTILLEELISESVNIMEGSFSNNKLQIIKPTFLTQREIAETPLNTLCWVAREVYGVDNIKWVLFRNWLYGENGPKWLQKLYTKFGERFANWISDKPFIKKIIRNLMDFIINKYETKRIY